MGDLRERVPGHSLIDELLRQFDRGAIRIGDRPDELVVDDAARGWFRGVLGERRVAELLGRLGAGWTVLHSVPIGRRRTDIDHVVVGPPGVFTINTKYSPGKQVWTAGHGLRVDNHQVSYLSSSAHEATAASDRLSAASGLTVPVVPVLVFVEPGRLTRTAPSFVDGVGIVVCSDAELLRMLQGRREFSDEQITRIVAAAVRPETWHDEPEGWSDGAHMLREFAALEAAVAPGLGAPVVRPSRARSTAANAGTKGSAGGRSRGAASSRPPRRSRAGQLATGLVLPLAAVVIGLIVLESLVHR
jgi:hypothetical protein